MSDLPSVDQALEVIDAATVSEYDMLDGSIFLSWRTLSFALFPKGSPHWTRPTGQPHGRDQSPAVVFMDNLGFDPRIRTLNMRRGKFYGRAKT